jgi:hypothetical protein
MKPHREIQDQMYDCVTGRLSAREQEEIEEHCRECAECRADLNSLRALVEDLPLRTTEPSDERDENFWTGFANRVTARISIPPRPSRFWSEWVEELQSLLTRSWKPVGAAAAVLAIALIAFLLIRPEGERPPAVETGRPPSLAVIRDTTRERFADYLRKSNMLLVGLANRKVKDDVVDLSAEEKLSRQLVHESRELQESRLDPEASRLVGDMERILIEIASRNGTTDRRHFDLIRSGIRQENLLFKVRTIETLYDSEATAHEHAH